MMGQKPRAKTDSVPDSPREAKARNEFQELKNNFEKEQLLQKNRNQNISQRIDALDKNVNLKIEKLDTKYEYYLLFGGILIALIGFLINFLGRQLIKERVELLIQKTAFAYAQKTTNQVINEYIANGKIEEAIEQSGQPVIEKIIKKIERDGFTVIDNLKIKGEEAISSMLAKHSDINIENVSDNPDEQLSNAKKVNRANEFFELAMSSKDPLVQIELYQKVLEIEPDNPHAYNNLGASYNNAYNYKKAIEVLQKGIEIASNYALPYANLANSYNLLGNLDEAIKYADKAMQLDPKVDYTYSVKGNVLTKQGKLDEAEETFNKAIKLNENSPEAYFARGYFYEETRQFNKSEADYIKAENLGLQDKAMLYNNMAVLYRRQKNFGKAIEYLEKARSANPLFPNIDGTLALIYADKKDRDNFYKYLVVALEKGCPVWKYLSDPGFDDFRDEEKLKSLLESYKKKYVA